MKSLKAYQTLNESVIDQIRYSLIPKYGEKEYNMILAAKPVSMLDGTMYFSITTKEKPANGNYDRIHKSNQGWTIEYNKHD